MSINITCINYPISNVFNNFKVLFIKIMNYVGKLHKKGYIIIFEDVYSIYLKMNCNLKILN